MSLENDPQNKSNNPEYSVNHGVLTTPTNAEALPSTWVERQPDKKGFTKKQKIIAGISGAALALGIGAGVKSLNNNGEQMPPNGTVATAEVTPGTNKVAEIVPTANPNRKTDVYSQTVEKRNLMDVDSFELQPRSERVAFAQYLIDQTVERGTYDSIYGEGKPDHKYAHIYTKPSLANTGQEILDNDLFKLQVSYMQFVEGELKPYDTVDGPKVLSSVYWDVGNKVVTNDYKDAKQQEQTLARITPLGDKHTAVNTSELVKYTDINGEVVQSKIVTSSDSNNKILYMRFVYHENTSYDGKPRADWYAENMSASLARLN